MMAWKGVKEEQTREGCVQKLVKRGVNNYNLALVGVNRRNTVI